MWLRVSSSAGRAHERHGDRVSLEPQDEGTSCGVRRATPRPPVRAQPRDPGRSVAWVCHERGQRSAWMMVPVGAVSGHARHGDLVSFYAQDEGDECGGMRDAPPPRRREDVERERDAGWVWACHVRGDGRAWIRVVEGAADVHARHGDRLSRDPRQIGSECRNTDQPATRRDTGRDEDRDRDDARDRDRDRDDARDRDRDTDDRRGGEERRDPDERRGGDPEPPQDDPTWRWVCHTRGQATAWLRVPITAADAHARHGDRVSGTPREVGETCSNG
ncbi:MAG: hypothetical protein OEZ65_08445 [Gemmatimonadota bacterium]|nr:hypothetical protein [Gemmatimonadota bacterium]MDH5759606.1 hypothetical protein [Gemmatimonadota bacterium]